MSTGKSLYIKHLAQKCGHKKLCNWELCVINADQAACSAMAQNGLHPGSCELNYSDHWAKYMNSFWRSGVATLEHGWARAPPYLDQGVSWDLHKFKEIFGGVQGGSRLCMSLKVHRISFISPGELWYYHKQIATVLICFVSCTMGSPPPPKKSQRFWVAVFKLSGVKGQGQPIRDENTKVGQ